MQHIHIQIALELSILGGPEPFASQWWRLFKKSSNSKTVVWWFFYLPNSLCSFTQERDKGNSVARPTYLQVETFLQQFWHSSFKMLNPIKFCCISIPSTRYKNHLLRSKSFIACPNGNPYLPWANQFGAALRPLFFSQHYSLQLLFTKFWACLSRFGLEEVSFKKGMTSRSFTSNCELTCFVVYISSVFLPKIKIY